MAPLSKAHHVAFVEDRRGVRVYSGEIDTDYAAVLVHGGYALGLIVSACVSSQAHTSHPIIVHLNGHFLLTCTPGSLEVHIRTIRTGRSYVNLTAELVQKNEVRISAQAIFRSPSKVRVPSPLTLSPPSPYARRIPLHLHPSLARFIPLTSGGVPSVQTRWAEDTEFMESNRTLGHTGSPTIGGGGLEWGAWLELVDPSAKYNESFLPLAGDIFLSLVELLQKLLPKEQGPPLCFYPSLVLSTEFKAKIPDDPAFSSRMVGLYSCCWFLNDGQYDAYVEVWSSPSEFGGGEAGDNWREKQVCLATTHQTGLSIPMPGVSGDKKLSRVKL